MNKGQRQIVAEKISSTVRILELLNFDYEVAGPKRHKTTGNKSPRVVTVKLKGAPIMYVYNGFSGHTWANWVNGDQALGVGSIEALYEQLSSPDFAKLAATRARTKEEK